ncbi:HAMP domain-containing sensor histidine kinase [Sphingomonas cynarae]|uniref:histidine kinase n=1 Tax=Sphingomonas cynarae TaxID=930197 RepID=A0ABP7D5W8_9SPHN
MNWRSTTVRFAALVFLLQIAAAGVLLLAVRVIVHGQVYAGAAATGEMVRQDVLAVQAQGVAAIAHAIVLHTIGDTGSRAVLLLTDAAGRPLAGNLDALPPNVMPDGQPVQIDLYRRRHATPEAMLVRVDRLAGGLRLLTGSVVEDEARTVRLLELAMLVALSLAVAFAALAAWLAARMIVLRLGDTVATLDAVRDGALSRRVPADASGDAFALLAASVNATLDRTGRLVEELTLATDMLAHDLKSPLTRLRSALERAAVAADTPAAQEAVERAQAEGQRLLTTVETALRISRAEAGIGRDAFAPVDLAIELEEIAEIYGPLVEEAGRAIRVVTPVRPTLKLHRELMAQALGNLIDNAAKYGAGTITLAVEAIVGGVRVSVSDEGAGIAPEHRAAALRRFGRVDEARGGSGAGLGLSLVGAVARLHGGALALQDAGGLRVVIDLPVGEEPTG